MKGALASLARRRAISVFPTPVGPIMRMFLGVISWRMFSPSCMRRQRLRSAIATARLAAFWPTMYLSSSEAISRGVMLDIVRFLMAREFLELELFDGVILIGVDTDIGGDAEAVLDDAERVEFGVTIECARCRQSKGATGTDGHDAFLGLDDVAVAGDDQ